MINGYIPVTPMFFQAEEPLKVSLYLYMPLNKKLLLLHSKGDILSAEMMFELLKMPRSQILCPKHEIDAAMVEITAGLYGQLQGSSNITPEASAIAVKCLKAMIESPGGAPASRQMVTKAALDEAVKLVESVVAKLSLSNNQASNQANNQVGFGELLSSFKNNGSSIEGHNKYCSALSVLFLLSGGKGTSKDVVDLAFASMSHDIGLKSVSEEEMLRHVKGEEIMGILNPAEKKKVSVVVSPSIHIEATLQSLKDSSIKISDGIYTTISEHHENYDGSGPLRISGIKIYRPAQILRLVDDIIALFGAVKGPSDLKAAILQLKRINTGSEGCKYYNEELFTILDNIVQA